MKKTPKKVQRTSALAEAAKVLGISQADVIAALPKCAPDFASRSSKLLTQEEVSCIGKQVAGTCKKCQPK